MQVPHSPEQNHFRGIDSLLAHYQRQHGHTNHLYLKSMTVYLKSNEVHQLKSIKRNITKLDRKWFLKNLMWTKYKHPCTYIQTQNSFTNSNTYTCYFIVLIEITMHMQIHTEHSFTNSNTYIWALLYHVNMRSTRKEKDALFQM